MIDALPLALYAYTSYNYCQLNYNKLFNLSKFPAIFFRNGNRKNNNNNNNENGVNDFLTLSVCVSHKIN